MLVPTVKYIKYYVNKSLIFFGECDMKEFITFHYLIENILNINLHMQYKTIIHQKVLLIKFIKRITWLRIPKLTCPYLLSSLAARGLSFPPDKMPNKVSMGDCLRSIIYRR